MRTSRLPISMVAASLIVAACQATTPASPGPTPTPTPAPAAPTATPAPTPTATPTRTPRPTPAPVPTAYTILGATFLSGTAACRQVEDGTDTRDERANHGRGYVMRCAYTVNDPRLDGHERLTFSYDAWGDGGGALAVQWGEGRIETAGGTWEGRWSGVVFPGLRDEITLWYRGGGGYVGLTLYLRITGSTGHYDVEGLIFPVEPPPR